MSTNAFLIDAATRHAIFVQRFAGGQVNELRQAVPRLVKEVQDRLAGVAPDSTAASRLNLILLELQEVVKLIYTEEMGQELLQIAFGFAEEEAAFSVASLNRATTAAAVFVPPSAEVLQAAVFTNLMTVQPGVDAMTIGEALEKFGDAKANQVTQLIRDGFLIGDTNQELIAKVSQIIETQHPRQVETIVRTSMNAVSNVARQETLRANEDLIDGYEWVSKLDHRVTATCAALDGKIFALGDGPKPPQHWGCRSTTVAAVKREFQRGAEVSGARDSEIGEVSHLTTYPGWLRKQPVAFQREVLGDVKYALWKDGGLKIDQFVDLNYKPLTLQKLRETYPLSFERAGL